VAAANVHGNDLYVIKC